MPDQAAGLAEHLDVVRASSALLPDLARVEELVVDALDRGGKLLAFGNGGSAADAQHLAAELVGRFRRPRGPLPAIALTTDTSILTGIGNDYSFDEVFARQVTALATSRDVVTAFSTSGRSPNVVLGLRAARAAGAATVLFTGHPSDPGPAVAEADVAIVVPSTTTPRIQEVHAVFVHLLSDAIDEWASRPALPSSAHAQR